MIIVSKVIEECDMKHFLFRSNRRSDLVKGKYGIFEPRDYLDVAEDKELKKVKVILVPLVTFDKSGNRLGRCAGFYDRFLPK
jgi:5-formyltetrahydrofolate cyclo-ligase